MNELNPVNMQNRYKTPETLTNLVGIPRSIVQRQLQHLKDLIETAEKIRQLELAEQRPVQKKLEDKDIPPDIELPLQRNFLVSSFNRLVETGSLDVLKTKGLAEDFFKRYANSVYAPYVCNEGSLLKMLEDLEEEYYQHRRTMAGQRVPTFLEGVVYPLLSLKDRNLVDLEKHLLTEKTRQIESAIESIAEGIKERVEHFEELSILSRLDPKTFQYGNFGFLCRNEQRGIQNAFNLLNKTPAFWEIFAKPLPNGSNWMAHCSADKEFRSQIMDVLNEKDGHSNYSMSWVIDILANFHPKQEGLQEKWESYVRECIQSYSPDPLLDEFPRGHFSFFENTRDRHNIPFFYRDLQGGLINLTPPSDDAALPDWYQGLPPEQHDGVERLFYCLDRSLSKTCRMIRALQYIWKEGWEAFAKKTLRLHQPPLSLDAWLDQMDRVAKLPSQEKSPA